MSAQRKLHLNAFLMNTGHHEASWRHPDTEPEHTTDIAYYQKLAQIAERAKLDSLFLADGYVLLGNVKYRASAGLEPFTMLSALAAATSRIGLIATVSTTYNEPFHVARMFASLDHISKGRAGWNIVTSSGDATAQNFGLDAHPEHTARYERAREFVETVTELWDSWEDDALVIDRPAGIFADTDKVRPIHHKGPAFAVRGPLNIPRPPQGYPLLVQAGSSEDGKEFAAQTAEAIFTAQQTLAEAQAFYADVKGRLARYGRSPEQLLILPGISPVIADTEQEAKEKEAYLHELTIPEYGLARLSELLRVDLFDYPLDGPVPLEALPDISAINGNKSRFQLVVDLARRDRLTIRELILRTAGGRGHLTFAGTAVQVADLIETWFTSGAADGFNIMPPHLPGSLIDFADKVVPELQRRGLFRTEYDSSTLRGHLGLARPVNRFSRAAVAE
ncbi:LLM class flavin-dependent oxidoreductase [Paenibacillus athensensis]|uniref:Monooxygenase n=1 Tax=Paenibacillus athensensis TaxID=1967502 RepID=A0A4Y8Q400_9BACL|nr:LLM class flavin-dependent oxidoreductase [Paenibacillus athensensis]MCD1258414.1 LLM class flavin-dependent oxidoreductase [Paenibacillus athensensis]